MSSIRYEFSDEELNNFKPKLLYLTQSEYGDDWHSTPHYHPFLELLYVFEGKGEFLIDGQAFSLRRGDEPYYPINDEKNTLLYQKYKALADGEKNVLFGGRLGLYRYFDMDKAIEAALFLAERELGKTDEWK